ncbi:MAG: PIN domain-containing protein, partial [Planctomycetes bacterium]|nr:PIN domain-containing protein [Planctomycetota bacterium]
DAYTDAETLQEILHRYLALRRTREGFAVFDGFARLMGPRVLPLEARECLRARALAERYSWASARDLIHLAVCLSAGIRRVLSQDRDFDRFEGIERVDPVRLAESLA